MQCRNRFSPRHTKCKPPWHFLGWFFASKIPAMRHARQLLQVPLRFGESVGTISEMSKEILHLAPDEYEVDIWVHDECKHLAEFWAEVDKFLKEEGFKDVDGAFL